MSTKYQVTTILTNGAVINSGVVTLPTANIATSTEAGLVMPVAKTDDMTQEVGVDTEGKLYTTPGSGGTTIGTTLAQYVDVSSSWSNLLFPTGFIGSHSKFMVSIVIDTSASSEDYHIFGQSIMYLGNQIDNKGFLVGINSSGNIMKACDVQGFIDSNGFIWLTFSNWDSNISANNVNYICVTATPISES